MSWKDPARVEALKKLWADGLSASRIAAHLGGFGHCGDGGRSAVIGKVRRLGLPYRESVPSRTNRLKSTKRKLMPVLPPKPVSQVRILFEADYVPPVEELVIPLNERKCIQTLEPNDCRWPIGDPQQPDFHFCGKAKIPNLPYCEVHARRAFRPPEPRPRPPASAPAPVQKDLEAA